MVADILDVIKLVSQIETHRGRDPIDVYTRGNCGNLYSFLKKIFPDAQPIILKDYHIVTYCNGRCYDIGGERPYPQEDLILQNDALIQKRISWMSNNYSYYREREQNPKVLKRDLIKKEKMLMAETLVRLKDSFDK